jgi:fatty-acyl-CoA synthase
MTRSRDHGVTHLLRRADRDVAADQCAGRFEKRGITAEGNAFNTRPRRRRKRCCRSMANAGFDLTHLYGLTETYGPAAVNEWHANGTSCQGARTGNLKAGRACATSALEALTVIDPKPWTRRARRRRDDGRGHVPRQHRHEGLSEESEGDRDEAFAGGWFHSGDLGVMHPDGYIQLKDRSKDIIISGGENISSIEVEDVLYKHPAVDCCGRGGAPDDKWGEVPCAFVELKPGKQRDRGRRSSSICRSTWRASRCPSG